MIKKKHFLNESNIKSNDSPITGERLSHNIGLAVFKNDKLAGELNAIETICFLNIRILLRIQY